MRSIIKQSRTVEDAIKEALLELDAKEHEVEVEIIEEASKGLFGLIGVKDAVVRVTIVNDSIEIANNFITTILNHMSIEAKSEIKKEGSTLLINITDINPSDMGILIGKRGSTLDSLQYLVSLAINKGGGEYLRVLVDTEGYREKREATLIRLASKMAEKSKQSRRPIKLEPMNPYERRIIHSALQDFKGISTYSEGEEPYRRVVIQYK